ncbi:MAG: Ig-like domain-containing protein [Candidatus Aminicenantes bacterium]|nr:Ig-like domain-containing protein [Candidatus Aminicenantes bacterium]
MKKTIIVLLAAALVVSFAARLTGQEKNPHRLYKPANTDIMRALSINPTEDQIQKEEYLRVNKLQAQKHAKQRAAARTVKSDKPQYTWVEFVEDSASWRSDYSGNLVWSGACQNTGTTGATFVKVEIDVYNSGGFYIGSAETHVWGGSNVELAVGGAYTNALRPNQYGFFSVRTNIPFASAYNLNYTITDDPYDYYLTYADLDINPVYYGSNNGYLNFSGEVENHSAFYVAYGTKVFMAALDPTNSYVLDVYFADVDGATYNTDPRAVYPHTSEPFSLTFQFAQYSESAGGYMAGLFFYEALTDTTDGEYPFGAFSTPVDGSTVASSVAVTGWALDDTGVSSVKIYREEGSNLVYIGDATFVDGARPDIAAAYPYYPLKSRAGWGYMMLTNFLPGGGNGTFVLHAIASDGYGKSTDLGVATIYCDNAHAVKPFGAIDTPTPGGVASGGQYRNVGWVLTPTPNIIPINGSTIEVYVDSSKKGNATYNVYRADIAGLFPGYPNSNGALAYYKLNTYGLSNGLHVIFWIATDNAGNADGIGSRFFSVSNTLTNSAGLEYQKAAPQPFQPTPALMDSIPTAVTAPVLFKKGYRDDVPFQDAPMAPELTPRIDIHELERVELQLPNLYAGFQAVGGKYKPLPVGSTLDTDKGMFYWLPGPAFLGEFNLVFIMKNPDGTLSKKNVTIAVNPKIYNQ